MGEVNNILCGASSRTTQLQAKIKPAKLQCYLQLASVNVACAEGLQYGQLVTCDTPDLSRSTWLNHAWMSAMV